MLRSKNMLYVALCLLLTLTVSAIYAQDQTQPEIPQDGRLFVSVDGGVQFIVPNSWSVSDSSNPNIIGRRVNINLAGVSSGELFGLITGDYCGSEASGLSCNAPARDVLIYYLQTIYPINMEISDNLFEVVGDVEYLVTPNTQYGIKRLAPGFFVILSWFPANDENDNANFRRVLETISLSREFINPYGDIVIEEEPEAIPETIEIPAEPTPPPAPEMPSTLQLLISSRLDVETLAGLTLGAQRPEGWSGNTNSADPDLAISIRLDLELLAYALNGGEQIEGWFGIVPSSPFAIARDIRHDLELLADAVELIPRPTSWAGAPASLRCDRATQALVSYLEHATNYILTADYNSPTFCEEALRSASVYAEQFIASTVPQEFGEDGPVTATSDPRITGATATGYIDLAGTVRGGIFPRGERFEVVARQSGDSATLLLVRGVGFELFVDYRDTNIPQSQFLTVRSVAGMRVDPRCVASWCD
jgi:hypothetical protein